MAVFKTDTVYFSKPGKENTEKTLQLAVENAKKWHIDKALVATTTGQTGRLAVEMLQGVEVIAVTHATGFKGLNTQELTDDNRALIEKGNGKVLTVQHSFGGVNRAIRKKTGTYFPDEIIADVLRVFSAGMKVIFEIAMMAADAGIVDVGEPVLAIAGTGRGADTAAIMVPANSFDFFNIQLLDLVCIPASQHPAFK